MKILVKQAHITDSHSQHHGQVKDILIENGLIAEIAPNINSDADHIYQSKGMHISPGWVDVFASFNDPGYEYKETLETGAAAAAAGGYTDVFVIPNTKPVIDSKAQVAYICQKAKSLPVNIHPVGAISKQLEGKELAEMYDMQQSGAIAFSDGINPVQSSGLLLKALQYVKAFSGVIIQLPDDRSIGASGLINEGIVSTRLGLPGKPMMAEEIIIARDIKLARYAESKIHFTGVTTAKSIEYIKRAKDAGLDITCSVTPYHLFFNEEDLLEYDTNLKVYPPLRPPQVVKMLRNAVLDGTVDCIATHHLPHEYDSKVLEFEYAKYGMTGLETAYAVLKTILPELHEDKLVDMLSNNPRKIFGLPTASIASGQAACMTIFDPSASWTLLEKNIRSKSKNTAFIGKPFIGKPIGIINGDRLFFND